MWHFTLYLLYGALLLGMFLCKCKVNVELAMKDALIVPEVIPVAPRKILKVSFTSGVNADLGEELTPTQVKDQPSVSWDNQPNLFYTLSFIDADFPSRADPTYSEINLWLVVNIPGGEVSMGETLTEYIGSSPSKTSGLHRYLFLVYVQPSELTFDEPHYISNSTFEERANFSIHKFASMYKLGSPVFGNFYLAQYDDYVPILQNQVGIDDEVKTFIKFNNIKKFLKKC